MNKLLESFFTIKESLRYKENIYLDNAGATPIDSEVFLAMRKVEKLYANPSGIYRSGVEVKNKIEVSRKVISSILNSDTNEVIFTGSGTESINLAIIGCIKNHLLKNKNNPVIPKVITSNIEHSAVLESLHSFEKDKLIELVYLKVDDSGQVKENDLREILKESNVENKSNIILVSVMYANNETGRVQPVKEIGRIIDEYNRAAREARGETKNLDKILFHIDGMQSVNYLDIDVKKLRCDLFSMNGSKIYGPKGIGILYKKKDVNLYPVVFGGGQENGLRSGTEDVQKIVGIAKAMQLAKEKKKREVIRLLELQKYFLENIKKEIPEVRIYTEKNEASKVIVNDKINNNIKINYFNINSLPNNINIGLPNILSDELVIRLDYASFDVSHKSACASNETGEGSYVLRAMGRTEKESNENIRITMGRNTKLKDMQKLILEIKNIYYKYKTN